MGRYRKRPIVIEAHRWHENGDHPADACEMINPAPMSSTQFEPFMSEGKVVRYYRHPEVPGTTKCEHCKRTMHDHGWIDTLEGGHTVCPGDWIITGIKGEYYPCKPDIFDQTYEPVPEPAKVDAHKSDPGSWP